MNEELAQKVADIVFHFYLMAKLDANGNATVKKPSADELLNTIGGWLDEAVGVEINILQEQGVIE